MKIFDTHSHYDDEKFDALGRDELISRLFSENVVAIVGAGVDIPSSKNQLALSEKYPNFFAAVGFHPSDIPNDIDVDVDIDEAMTELESLLKHPKCVAVGEIGLDYYWESNPPRETQKSWLRAQLELAEKTKFPVVIHDREAHGDIFDILCEYKNVTGVIHSCSMSAEMACQLLERGYYISFSGVVTYKNADKVARTLKTIPDDRILFETDCPYLSPVPMRGKINHSGHIEYTIKKAAELRGCDPDMLAERALENACRVFGIDKTKL